MGQLVSQGVLALLTNRIEGTLTEDHVVPDRISPSRDSCRGLGGLGVGVAAYVREVCVELSLHFRSEGRTHRLPASLAADIKHR